MKKQLNILIPAELFQRLRRHCFELEVPVVVFVTRSIVELLKREERAK